VQYWLVMPAAGSGSRFGGAIPKQYQALGAGTVMECAAGVFLADARCQGLIIALDAADERFDRLPLASQARVRRVAGGARRCDSVGNALDALDADADDWVLVHDAARPCITRAAVDALLAACQADPVGGLLAVPVSDTLKRAGESGQRVLETAPRERLWRALTPQMFRLGMLRQALAAARSAGREPTDEAQAIEWLGHAPRLVTGDPGNNKITTAADLALASAWLARENQA
jgi:2-C-methyl-D-erythritol 4-phosphate cytidylyltransferase